MVPPWFTRLRSFQKLYQLLHVCLHVKCALFDHTSHRPSQTNHWDMDMRHTCAMFWYLVWCTGCFVEQEVEAARRLEMPLRQTFVVYITRTEPQHGCERIITSHLSCCVQRSTKPNLQSFWPTSTYHVSTQSEEIWQQQLTRNIWREWRVRKLAGVIRKLAETRASSWHVHPRPRIVL